MKKTILIILGLMLWNLSAFAQLSQGKREIWQVIADSLARKLYASVFIALATAPLEIKGQGVSDGISVTFRCVVDGRVWTLKYQEPDEGDFLKLTDVCTQMVKDAEAGNFDTAKYLEMLKKGYLNGYEKQENIQTADNTNKRVNCSSLWCRKQALIIAMIKDPVV